jgi:hypothetical protein
VKIPKLAGQDLWAAILFIDGTLEIWSGIAWLLLALAWEAMKGAEISN